MSRVVAFAPASVGNVAAGFDVLGLALDGPGDRCCATRVDGSEVRIRRISGLPAALPVVAARNTAGRAAQELLWDRGADFTVELELHKGIPVGSGMGGSAASAVAAVVAVNQLFDDPLPHGALLHYALEGEALASGTTAHADNVAASLFGGLTLAQHDNQGWHVGMLPVPNGLRCVLVHPHLEVRTASSRGLLATQVPMQKLVEQISVTAGFVAACHSGDLALLRRCLRDPVVEAQRAHLVTGFADVKRSALDNGAIGCSLSGSGPSVFAWTDIADATAVATAMQAAFASHGVAADAWISSLQAPGARVEDQQ